MNDEPLPKDLQDLLSDLAPPVEVPGAKEALLQHLHATVGVATAAGVTATATTAATATAGKIALTVPWWVPVGTLIAGLSGGVAIERVRTPEPLPPPPVVAVVPAPVVVEVIDAGVVEVDAGVNKPTPIVHRPKLVIPEPVDAGTPVVPVVVVEVEDTLRSERLLLDTARAAMARSPADALVQLEAHEKKFARGQLAEERDALRIQVLVAVKPDEAKTRFAEFERTYPHSPLLNVLRGAVLGTP